MERFLSKKPRLQRLQTTGSYNLKAIIIFRIFCLIEYDY